MKFGKNQHDEKKLKKHSKFVYNEKFLNTKIKSFNRKINKNSHNN